MWKVNLTISPGHQLSSPRPSVLNDLEERTNPELVQWYHTKLFRPVRKTLLQAIKKVHFATQTNLIVELTKNLPLYMATEKVHTNKTRKNIQSRRTLEPTLSQEAPMDKL